jgi:hypothetical protein
VTAGREQEAPKGRLSCKKYPFGRLAQLVEHLLYTQVAAGSSPAPPIAKPDRRTKIGSIYYEDATSST